MFFKCCPTGHELLLKGKYFAPERSKRAATTEYHRIAGEKFRHVVASGSTYLDLELVHIGGLKVSVDIA